LLSFGKLKIWITLRLAKVPCWIVVMFVGFLPMTMSAQSPGPREYLNIPVDQTIAYIDYTGTSSETVTADLPLPNNESVSTIVAPTVLASFPIQGRYAGVSLTVPYSKVEVAGAGGKTETWGFNDPAIAFHKNIFGLQAFRHDEIGKWVPQTFLSFHFTVNVPLGSYDRNSPVNTGANRWAFTPLVNLNIPMKQGVSWIEVYGWSRFFTTNSEFQGSNQLAQDPLGIIAFWYSHNLGKKMYAAIGGYYDYGGQSYVNGVAQHDISNAFRPSVSISRKIGKFRLSLRYENTASKPNTVSSSGLLTLKISLPVLFNF
jgi:hypothetical protein